MDNKIKNIAFWVMVSVVLLLCIFLFFYIRSESYQCMRSPLVYGVSKYESKIGEFTCTCSAPMTDPIVVTKDNITKQSLLYNYNRLPLIE